MNVKLNTTEIGDNFEMRSLGIIQKVIEEEQLGHLIDHIKIFQKKEYFSAQRKKYIKFDLAIEIWPPGAKRFVMLYLIECKDYEKRVPVSKIEDFHSKILQVAGVNVKGIFISNSPLQEGGFNIAESVGMMVIQGESSSDYNIILHNRTRDDNNRIPFIENTFDNTLIDSGIQNIEKIIDSKILNVFKLIADTAKVSYNIDRLNKEDIELLTIKELNSIDPKILSADRTLSSKKLIEYLNTAYGIKISEISSESNLLGSCNFKDNTVGINKIIIGTRRELFILSHEFGHYLLHQKLSIGGALYEAFDDSKYNFKTDKHDLINPRNWIEWQANTFASLLILSQVPFVTWVLKCQIHLGRPEGRIYLDDKYDNLTGFTKLIEKLSYILDVSKTTIIFRLRDLNFINDQTRLKSIGQIIALDKEGLFIDL